MYRTIVWFLLLGTLLSRMTQAEPLQVADQIWIVIAERDRKAAAAMRAGAATALRKLGQKALFPIVGTGDQGGESSTYGESLPLHGTQLRISLRIRRGAIGGESWRMVQGMLGTLDGAELDGEQRLCRNCETKTPYASLAEEVVGALARRARDKAVANARLKVITAPLGVWVKINRKIVGPSGLTYRIPPGQHTVEIAKQGHYTMVRRILLVPNESHELRLPLPYVTSEVQPKFRRWKWLFWGVGVVGGATGTALVATGERRLGVGSLAVAGGFVATGLVMWRMDQHALGRKRRVYVAPLLAGAPGLAVGGAF